MHIHILQIFPLDGFHQFFRFIVRHQFPVLQNQDPIRDRFHITDHMRGQQDDLILGELPDVIAQVDALLRIQSGRRLIEYEDLRITEKRLSEKDSLDRKSTRLNSSH